MFHISFYVFLLFGLSFDSGKFSVLALQAYDFVEYFAGAARMTTSLRQDGSEVILL